jgi:hypothetical protein
MHSLPYRLLAWISQFAIPLFISAIVMSALLERECRAWSGRISSYGCHLGAEHRNVLDRAEDVLVKRPSPKVQMGVRYRIHRRESCQRNFKHTAKHSIFRCQNKRRYLCYTQVCKLKVVRHSFEQDLPVYSMTSMSRRSRAAILQRDMKLPRLNMLGVCLINNSLRKNSLVENKKSALDRDQRIPRSFRTALNGLCLNDGLLRYGLGPISLFLHSVCKVFGPISERFRGVGLCFGLYRKIVRVNASAIHLPPLHPPKEH